MVIKFRKDSHSRLIIKAWKEFIVIPKILACEFTNVTKEINYDPTKNCKWYFQFDCFFLFLSISLFIKK